VSYRGLVSILVIVAVALVAVQVPRAEALEPLTLLVAAGAAVVVAFYTVVGVELVRGRPFHSVEDTQPDIPRDRGTGETP
jgi:drug/metabolite transporter (DMT)-like permease